MSKQDKKPYNQLNLLTRNNSTDRTDETDGRALHLRLYSIAKSSIRMNKQKQSVREKKVLREGGLENM